MNYKLLKLRSILKKQPNILNRLLTTSTKGYTASNEPVYDFKRNSPEALQVQATLKDFLGRKNSSNDALFEVPIVIGDKEIRNENVQYQLIPFDHQTKLARFYHADKNLLGQAIENCLQQRADWENSSFDYRAGIMLKAADKITKESRADILASTMLGQAKTVYQAG